jgi:hypothetical protein
MVCWTITDARLLRHRVLVGSAGWPTIQATFPPGNNMHGIFVVEGAAPLTIAFSNLIFIRNARGGPAAVLRSGDPDRYGVYGACADYSST